jgi:predicted dehydrogenase
MEPLRIGILGAARIVDNALAVPSRTAPVRLVVIAARDRRRAEMLAATHGIERVVDTYADVVSDNEIDVVYNPLVNSLHAPWNRLAIAAGKHVFSEKPFASNAVEADAVHLAGQHAGVYVVDGFHYLYHPVTQRLHSLLESGELGDLERVEVTMATPPPEPDDPRWSFALAGGALMDLGCYCLHANRTLARWGGGEPSLVSAQGGGREGATGVDEWVIADLRFPNGAIGRASCHMAADVTEMTFRIVGTLGEATASRFVRPDLDDRVLVVSQNGSRTEHLGTKSSYAFQLEALCNLIRNDVPMPTQSDDAVKTMRLVDESYRAIGFPTRTSTQTSGS